MSDIYVINFTKKVDKHPVHKEPDRMRRIIPREMWDGVETFLKQLRKAVAKEFEITHRSLADRLQKMKKEWALPDAFYNEIRIYGDKPGDEILSKGGSLEKFWSGVKFDIGKDRKLKFQPPAKFDAGDAGRLALEASEFNARQIHSENELGRFLLKKIANDITYNILTNERLLKEILSKVKPCITRKFLREVLKSDIAVIVVYMNCNITPGELLNGKFGDLDNIMMNIFEELYNFRVILLEKHVRAAKAIKYSGGKAQKKVTRKSRENPPAGGEKKMPAKTADRAAAKKGIEEGRGNCYRRPETGGKMPDMPETPKARNWRFKI